MYLSRLVLNARHALARRDLANPYEMHSTLAHAFEDAEGERVLWRVEEHRGLKGALVLVQSLGEPDWERMAGRDRYTGYLLQPPESKPYLLPERLSAGQVLRFRLEANPTVTRLGKRHGLQRVDEQLQWLHRQAAKSGFSLLGAAVSKAERRQFVKRQEGRPIVVMAVRFDGYLRVTEPVALREALKSGLGHGKALGLGLLSVAPVR